MIIFLFIAMACIDWRSFLPCPMLPPLFGALAFIAMVAEGLQ
jgi:hypothetical protein